MRRIITDVLIFMAILAVIGLFGTADAFETGIIDRWQSFWQSALFTGLAAAFGLGAWALERGK